MVKARVFVNFGTEDGFDFEAEVETRTNLEYRVVELQKILNNLRPTSAPTTSVTYEILT